jgi:hypothetical protein
MEVLDIQFGGFPFAATVIKQDSGNSYSSWHSPPRHHTSKISGGQAGWLRVHRILIAIGVRPDGQGYRMITSADLFLRDT